MRTNAHEVIEVLAKHLTTEQVADILNCFLSCECDPNFTDREAEVGGMIFHNLCDLRPEAITVAQGR